MMRAAVSIRLRIGLLAALFAAPPLSADDTAGPNGLVRSDAAGAKTYFFAPKRRMPEGLESFFRNIPPGGDEFPEEKDALELAIRLRELSESLRRDGPAHVSAAIDGLLAADFKGGRLTPADAPVTAGVPALEIFRSAAPAAALVRDRSTFAPEMTELLRDFDTVAVAEMLVTAIERGATAEAPVRTVVRYDFVGAGKEVWRAQRVGQWEMRWQRGPDGSWRVTQWIALDHLRSRAKAPVFTEATGTAFAGVESMRTQLGPGHDAWLASLDSAFKPDTMALHGISAGDIDGDGVDDLYVAQPTGLPNRLYRGRPEGTFEDVTSGSGLDVLDGTSQSLFGDVDNDGDQDAVLVVRGGLLLFLNDGKGRFTRDAEAFRFKNPLRGSPTTAAMADYDRDGFLDVYLGTYSYFIGAAEGKAGPATPYHDAKNGPPNVLFRNDGHGRFMDVTDEVGLDENNDRFTLAAAWGDYDADGWPDLMLANDFGRKNLYHNLGASGTVRFKDVAPAAGIEDYGAGMSAAWLDYDHDGRLDIYTGNMWTAAGLRITAQRAFLPDAPADVRALYHRHARGNSLFRNRGDGTFEDVTAASRTAMGRWAWASDVIDFDLDGWEDLYVVNGMFTRDATPGEPEQDLDSFFWRQVTARSPLTFRSGTSFDDGWRAINRLLIAEGSEAPHERAVFLRNDGKGGFDDVSGSVGLDIDQDDRAFAVLDYDRDGDPDLVVYAPRASPQLRVFRNDRPGRNSSVAVRLVGAGKSNRDAIGARVTVDTGETRLVKILGLGSGFLSQHSKELLFGLGKATRLAKVTVAWPSGVEQTFTDVPVDRRVVLEEGKESANVETLRAPSTSAAAPPPVPLAPPSATWLYEPYPAPDFTGSDLDGKKVSLSALRGKPALLLLWATWAPPSREALQELSKHAAELAQAGVSVIALSLDAAENERDVRAAAAGLGLPVVRADDETAGAYAVTNRFVFARREALRVPTAFLVNEKGDIARAYRDTISAADVVADVARLAATPAERLARALPFKGTLYSTPEPRNDFPYALDLAEQGFEKAALGAFERAAARDPNAITLYNLATLYIKHRRPAEGRAALDRALALKPDYAEANNSLGALLAQNGDVPGGIARFKAALQTRPDFADALNNLGFALFQTGDERQALALYEKALALQPDFPEAFNNLGIFYGKQGELDRAASYFKEALARRASYGEAATNLALVYMAQQDAAGAIRTLQLLLEKDPAFEMAYVTLARVYFGMGRGREAGQVLDQLLQRNPQHPIGLQMMRQLRGAR